MFSVFCYLDNIVITSFIYLDKLLMSNYLKKQLRKNIIYLAHIDEKKVLRNKRQCLRLKIKFLHSKITE